MKKNKKYIKKNVISHTLEVHTSNHHMEIAEDSFLPLLDPEGILADCYIKNLENDIKKADEFD